MPANENEFFHESLQDRDSVEKYLNALTNGFLNGNLTFASKEKQIILKPKGLLNLTVKAKRKGDLSKLNIQFEWKEN